MKKIVLILAITFGIVVTTNGQTFTKITNFPDANKQLRRVFSTSKDTTYIIASATKVLYWTTDGGTTWKSYTLSTEDLDLTDIYFTDKNNGWITGSLSDRTKVTGVLFKTTNGGVSWQNVSSTVPNIASNQLGCIRMNGQNGVIGNFRGAYSSTTFPSYYLTTDGGSTWTNKSFPTFSPFFPAATSSALRLSNNPVKNTFQMSVRVNSTYNAIYRSLNNGLTFTEAYTERDLGGNNFGLEILNINDTVYWISTDSPKKSLNNGASWSSFSYLPPSTTPVRNDILSGFFENSSEGIVVGENSSIYKTRDGGNRWIELQNINGTPRLRSLFMNSGTFWAVGESSTIYKAVMMVNNTPCVTNKPMVMAKGKSLSTPTVPKALFQWLNCTNANMPIEGATNLSYKPTVSGSYSVEILRENDCRDTSVCIAGVVVPCVTNRPTVTKNGIILSTDIVEGATYRWLDCANNSEILFETITSFTVQVNGSYKVEITRSNECKDTSLCVRVDICNKPVVTVSEYTLSTTNIGATYLLLDCNNNNARLTGATSSSYIATTTGRYSVEVSIGQECKDTSLCITLTRVGLIENTFATDLKLYPNPTSDNVTIELGDNYNNIAVEITNVLGQVITRKRIATVPNHKIVLPIEASSGIYFVRIEAKEGFASFRVVKE